MEDRKDNAKEAAHQRSESRWAALRSRQFVWREVMGLSVLIFVTSVAIAVLGWTFVTGDRTFIAALPGLSHIVRDRAPEEVIDVPMEALIYRRALDGMPLSAPEQGEDYIAVVIDNFVTARPASGIAYASLVIESPVEAGITRLLAFFHTDHGLERIGPIRSARPYLVEWAEEYDAMLVHVGGSDAALAMLKSGMVRDLNEFSAGAYFWRDRHRDAPHNAYTSGELLGSASERRYSEHAHQAVPAWTYKEDAAVEERPDGGTLTIEYVTDGYAVSWAYDPETNTYLRLQNNKEIKDEDGSPVRAKNIVVQYTEIHVIDSVGRRDIRTQGEGDVLLARDGVVLTGTWHREKGGRLTLMGDTEPLALDAGTTWIEVVPIGTDVAY